MSEKIMSKDKQVLLRKIYEHCLALEVSEAEKLLDAYVESAEKAERERVLKACWE